MTDAKRPNIVLVHTHDTGRWFGCYGHNVKTPNIDRVADMGVRFDTYFATAPQCSPSRASLLTGCYPHRVGMLGLAHLGWRLKEDVATLPSILAQAGYETRLFGTQHEASDGRALGYQATEVTSMPQRAAVVSRAFADYFERRATTETDQPLFASIGFWETHRPFNEACYEPSNPQEVEIPPNLPDTPDVRRDVAEFEGMLRAADAGVGVIMNALERTGLMRQTLLMITTDHGLAFPRAKGTLYDAGTGIGLITCWPGRIPLGRHCSSLLSNVDLLPTLAEVADATMPTNLDGNSFLPQLLGAEASEREYVFSEITWHDRYVPARGVRTAQWKYIKNFATGPAVYLPLDVHRSLSGMAVRDDYYSQARPAEELYDLTVDPGEQHNLLHEPGVRDELLSLRNILHEWMQRTDDPLLRGAVAGREASEWDAEPSPWPPENKPE